MSVTPPLPPLPTSFNPTSLALFGVTVAGIVEGFLAPFGITVGAHTDVMVKAAIGGTAWVVGLGAAVVNHYVFHKATAAVAEVRATLHAAELRSKAT